ncbi:MAG: 2-C-methyl-D-erythritol 4-phosphate cytidylyltransferase [Chitinophagaceae bacterium]|nr:2-C-methyl-D-erythritol 4-phosphate cytidylyltransferase [Chitinophagaceae bacterium]
MDKYAVIVAGGAGTRMGAKVPKQFLLLKNKPVLWYTLIAFLQSFEDLQIILVLPELYLSEGRQLALSASADRILTVQGGETRFHSVKNGLQLVPQNSIVFVHDGVRCLVTPALIHRCYYAALEKGNAIPAVTVTDSVRIETPGGSKMIDRDKVRIIQTPQTFQSSMLKAAFDTGYNPAFTDEASVAEYAGETICLVEGEPTNLKITQPVDLIVAEKVLEERGS